MNEKELTTEEWRAEKRRKKAEMAQKQSLPYDAKIKHIHEGIGENGEQ